MQASPNPEVEAVDKLAKAYRDISQELSKVIFGQQDVIKLVLVSIFSGGHCLLVGVPGLAKTLLVQTISQVLDLSFNRIQFTPRSDAFRHYRLGDFGRRQKISFYKRPRFCQYCAC